MKSTLRFQSPAFALLLPFVAGAVTATSAFSQSRAAPAPRPPMSDVKTPFVEPIKPAPVDTAPVRAAVEAHADVPSKRGPAINDANRVRHALDRVYHDVDADGALWARGENWKAHFGVDGVTILPRFEAAAQHGSTIALDLREVTVGGAPLAFQSGITPERDADRIVYSRGTLREVYDLGVTGLEQSFVFDALPSRGEVIVHVACTTELAKTGVEDRVELSNQNGRVTCSRAVAIDAAGVRTALSTRLKDGAIEIRVPQEVVEHARFPLVVDPLISVDQISGGGISDVVPDVSFDLASGRTAYVFEEVYSSTDHDIFVDIRNASNVSMAAAYVDISTNDWRNPKIADDRVASQFLVVANVGPVGSRQIMSRLVSPNAVLGAVFVPSAGVVGDNILPDVGGDWYPAFPSYFGVTWERDFASDDTDILFALVDPTSGVPSALNYVANASHTLDRHPSISKGTGDASTEEEWNLVWDHQYAPGDRDIYGVQITWDGTVVGAPFAIETSGSDEAYPTASSLLSSPGSSVWLTAFQRTMGTNDHDIIGEVFAGANFVTNADLSLLDGFDATQDQIAATADSDGHQFVVAYMESYLHHTTDLDIYLSQYAFVGGVLVGTNTHQILADNSSYEAWPQIAADHSSAASGSCVSVTWADDNFGGYSLVFGARDCGQVGGAVTSTCSGTGPGTACPCGPGSVDHGCPNSVNLAGAVLGSTGDAAVTADSFVLHATGMPTTSSCLYFQGSVVVAPGVFGDGLRCTGGTVVRLGSKTNVGGGSQYPTSGNPTISVKGAVPSTGGVRAYQVWYRNATSFCTPATFNLTNGLRVVWVP